MNKEKMTRDLLFHIRLGEDSSIEFKRIDYNEDKKQPSYSKDSMAHEIAAFANGPGGRLILGVDDKTRNVIGLPDNYISAIEEWIVNLSQTKINPPVNIDTYLLELPDVQGDMKRVIVVNIPRGIDIHQSCGKYYKRVGSTKRDLSRIELHRLFQQRSHVGLIRFDETLVPRTTLDDIDASLKKRFLKPDTSEHSQLDKLRLVTSDEYDQGLSVCGVLLLTADPTKWLPEALIQCVSYSGLERDGNDQLDEQEIIGPLDHQIDGAFTFVRRNMRVAATKQIGRKDIPQYDLGAIFEAIVNAVAHRDYSMTGRKIRLHMFADRLELYSPGELPETVTLDSLEDTSTARNERIVNLLSRYYNARAEAGRQALIERRGEGVPRITKTSVELSGKRPEYRLIDNNELLLTIYAAGKTDTE